MCPPAIHGKVLVHRRLQIIDARNIEPQRYCIGPKYIVRLDFRTTASVIELEGAVNVAVVAVFVHFASGHSSVGDDRVLQSLGAASKPPN